MLAKMERMVILLENGIVLFLILGIVLVVFLQVLSRYALHTPLSWTEELSRALLIWLTFVGGSLALRNKAHFSVEWVVAKLPDRVRSAFEGTLYVLMAVVLGVLLWKGLAMLPVVHLQTSPSLRVPMSYIYLSIPLGAALMLFHVSVIIVRKCFKLGS
jgi:TRAP-type C4-dicarboxylate transport system permease small subunit